MKYDSNMTKEQKQELLQKVKDANGDYIEGVFYGLSEQEVLDCYIEDTINKYLKTLENRNAYLKEEKFSAPEKMDIIVSVHFAFPKYHKNIFIEDISDMVDDDEDYRKGIYLDWIIEWLDDNLREECTEEITNEMYEAEKALYDAINGENTKDVQYAAEKALYDAIEKDYQVWWCEPIGTIEVETAKYAENEYKHLIKGAKDE